MIALASLLALVGTAVAAPVAHEPSIPVILSTERCDAVASAEVRDAVKVELGERLLDAGQATPDDFILLSLACTDDHANLLAVRQDRGTPVRRLVPFAGVAPVARPRVTALAIAELVRVDDLRNAPPPPAETVVSPIPEAPPTTSRSLMSSPIWMAWQGSFQAFSGFFAHFGYDRGGWGPGRRGWGWGAADEISFTLTGGEESRLMNAALAVLEWRGNVIKPEFGLGGRLGSVTSTTPNDTSERVGGGPVAFVGLEQRANQHLAFRAAIEGGYDFGHARGAWVTFTDALGVRW